MSLPEPLRSVRVPALLLLLAACGAPARSEAAAPQSAAGERPPAVQASSPAGGVDGQHVVAAAGGERPSTVVDLPAWGPAPGTSAEQHAAWLALVRELFLGDPPPERRAVLEAGLASVDVIDATPVFLDAVRGLDMADPDDVARAAALTSHWFEGQQRVLQLQLDDDPDPSRAANRLAQLQGWSRWWGRRAADPASLKRYRARVEELRAFLEQDRARRRAGEG